MALVRIPWWVVMLSAFSGTCWPLCVLGKMSTYILCFFYNQIVGVFFVFLKGWYYCLLLSCKSFSMYFGNYLLIRYMICKNFLSFSHCLFILLMVSLCYTKASQFDVVPLKLEMLAFVLPVPTRTHEQWQGLNLHGHFIQMAGDLRRWRVVTLKDHLASHLTPTLFIRRRNV